jgi:hypothetical protein
MKFRVSGWGHRAKLPPMRTLLQNRTPVQLLWIIAASNVLVAMSLGILGLRSSHLRVSQLPHSLIWASLSTFLFGLLWGAVTEQTLRDGITAERWPDSLLGGPRKLIAHPAFTVLNVLFFIAGCGYTAFSHAHNFGGTWAFLYPAMSLTRVINYLRNKPPSSSNDSLGQLNSLKPLQSEHWGDPSRPFVG